MPSINIEFIQCIQCIVYRNVYIKEVYRPRNLNESHQILRILIYRFINQNDKFNNNNTKFIKFETKFQTIYTQRR